MKKNNASETLSPAEKIYLADSLEENPYINWVVQNGRNLLLTLLALIGLFVLAYKYSFGNLIKSEYDYINAENDYNLLKSKKDGEALKKLEAILASHPELHGKYDSLIAQTLINQGNTDLALPYANRAIQRTKSENEPYFTSYAQTTLLIAEKKYDQALQNALALKQQISTLPENENLPGELLYAFNLLRIGMLQEQLNLNNDELKTWGEIKSYLNSTDNRFGKGFENLLNYYQEGKISLINYIDARENALRKS